MKEKILSKKELRNLDTKRIVLETMLEFSIIDEEYVIKISMELAKIQYQLNQPKRLKKHSLDLMTEFQKKGFTDI